MEYLLTVFAVCNLGVELHCIELSLGCFKCGTGTVRRLCRYTESLGKLTYEIGVAHPYYALFRNALEYKASAVLRDLDLSVFAFLTALYLAAESVRHELTSVADTEDRYADTEYLLRDMGRAWIVNTVGTACENDSGRVHSLDLAYWRVKSLDLAVYAALSDSSCDELIVLTSEIEDYTKLVRHKSLLNFRFSAADAVFMKLSAFST